MENTVDRYTINYENVVNANYLSAPTRKLASRLIENPYIVVGEYLQSLTDEDVSDYLDLVSSRTTDNLSEILLVTEMLSRAEGVFNTDTECEENVNFFSTLIACVDLHRKNMVRMIYENVSFSRDMMDKILIEKIND